MPAYRKPVVKARPIGVYDKPKRFGRIDITKMVDGDEVLYLRRWYLWRGKRFSIRVHHIALPDVDRWPHDHPWPFLAIILWGGYTEVWGKAGDAHPTRAKFVSLFNCHKATDLHRIIRFNRAGGAWTLFLTGAERRTWGFQTDEGWLPWREAIDRGVV
jgi:hypothetical protein